MDVGCVVEFPGTVEKGRPIALMSNVAVQETEMLTPPAITPLVTTRRLGFGVSICWAARRSGSCQPWCERRDGAGEGF